MTAPALTKIGGPALAFVVIAALAACGGGGGGTVYTPPAPGPSTSTQQVIGLALPQSSIGVEPDPTWGAVGGFTQATYSQVLAFAPGAQVMVKNLGSGASAQPHTLDVIASGVTPGMAFPASPSLSPNAAGGSSIGSGFASGTLTAGQLLGPFTLVQGTYFIGCAYHYVSNGMRDVLIVQPAAAPGPQATPPPSGGGGNPCPGGYC